MKRFEYKTVTIKESGFWKTDINEESIDIQLNELGAQGWELIATQYRAMGGTTYVLFYTFKREIEPS